MSTCAQRGGHWGDHLHCPAAQASVRAQLQIACDAVIMPDRCGLHTSKQGCREPLARRALH
eukprot:362836-Chlamydomonas_euryale.AAC.6